MSDDEPAPTLAAFLDAFESELVDLTGYGEADASALAETFAAQLIETLRRDPRWAAVARFDLELLLADWRRQVAGQIYRQIKDTAPVRDIYDAAKRVAHEAFSTGNREPTA